jgi:hypothetical protein
MTQSAIEGNELVCRNKELWVGMTIPVTFACYPIATRTFIHRQIAHG